MSASKRGGTSSLWAGWGASARWNLGKKLAGVAASVAPSIGALTEDLSGSASPKDLETLFQLIYLDFTAPRKDPVAFQAFQQQVGAFLANRNASPHGGLPGHTHGDHGPGAPPSPARLHGDLR